MRLFTSGSSPGGVVSSDTETISDSGAISSAASGIQYRPVVGDGAVTTSGTPFGTSVAWQDGTIIILQGTSNTNTVSIAHNDAANGVILNGDATLTAYDVLELFWDDTNTRWVEKGRNF